jgi:hypothetical protein
VKSTRKRLTYANVMSSIAVFLILGGATAVAAKKIGTKQLKANSVTTGKIKKNAVTTAKIKNNAVTGAKVRESTLGEVPLATTANNLAGQRSYVFKLGVGQSEVIATNGAVSVIAKCEEVAGNDRIRILAATTTDGAMMLGDTFHLGTGAGEFLNAATPEDQRVIASFQAPAGTTRAGFNIDRGWVMGPDAKMLGYNQEGTVLAVNYAGAKCVAGGVMNASG